MSAELRSSRLGTLGRAGMFLALSACSWFTDFKQQPKIDPWETTSDTIAFRGNPQGSVSIYGSAAPGFQYDRAATPQNAAAMGAIANPVAADSASVSRGRINYQINCAVCHGSLGKGDGPVMKYGLYPPAIGTAQSPAAGYPDGQIFGIIRNGKGLMPTYNRIEERDRWDIVNYIRSLQGKIAIAADTTHCRPGETGAACVPSATVMGPTRPSPYYGRPQMAGSASSAAPAMPMVMPMPDTTKKSPTDTTKKPEHQL